MKRFSAIKILQSASLIILFFLFGILAGCAYYGPSEAEEEEALESTIRSCDDVSVSKYGTSVGFETLVCGGVEMFAGPDGPTNSQFDSWNYTVISDSSTMDEMVSGFESKSDLYCEVDFETKMVPAVWDYRESNNCANIEICGIAEDGDKLNVVVYIHECTGLEDSLQSATPFHMVKVKKSDKPTVFRFIKHTENYK